MNYAEKITFIEDNFDQGKFPEQFSNQVYISSISKFESFGYVSNFSIKYLAEGDETYIINGKSKTLKSGQFIIISEGDIVEAEKTKNGSRSLGLSIFLDMQLINSLYRIQNSTDNALNPDIEETKNLEFYKDVISEDGELQNYFHKMLALKYSSRMDEATYLDIAEQLVAFNLRFDRKISSINAKKKSTLFEIYRRINIARDYLHESKNAAFDLNELSEIACLSKFFLIKKFKEIYGYTPQKYHSEIRVKRAVELLKQGNSVSDTAIMMGYSSIHYFSKSFKDSIGLSPKNYLSRAGLDTSQGCLRSPE